MEMSEKDEKRFWAKVSLPDPETGCMEWLASLRGSGYGQFVIRKPRIVQAHRFAYELLVGPIPEGLVIDHLCRNKACVRPDHLEPVTHRVNILRGVGPSAWHARKTHCPQGHEYNTENTHRRASGARDCRKCGAENARVRRARLTSK